jgi:hypothetical protein
VGRGSSLSVEVDGQSAEVACQSTEVAGRGAEVGGLGMRLTAGPLLGKTL